MGEISYRRHRFPPVIIQHAVCHRSELQHPTPDRFIGNVEPALGEQFLDVDPVAGSPDRGKCGY